MIPSGEQVDVVVVGAGGCGLTAGLHAAQRGRRVLILERGAEMGGSTAMSSGLIVAAGSRLQRAAAELGTPTELADDVLRRNGHASDPAVTHALCEASGRVMDWLQESGVELEHLPDYRYEGMSRTWLHAPPSRHGVDLVTPLVAAAERHPLADLHTHAPATGLLVQDRAVTGVTVQMDGREQTIPANAVVLAASGFGANANMVAAAIPELANAPYYGAPHADGGPIRWARALGAAVDHMTAYQSHSSIALPEMILVTTYLINHGALQVNQAGRRFGDETQTYARHAATVQAQPGRSVVEIFDERILQATLRDAPRFAECLDAGIVRSAASLPNLARQFDLDAASLRATIHAYNAACTAGEDEFGRTRFGAPLSPPYYAVRVTSALVQTLGGLRIDAAARVLDEENRPISGLYAGGGTAAGFAGDRPEGYLAGMGLLAAFGLGWLAANHVTQADDS